MPKITEINLNSLNNRFAGFAHQTKRHKAPDVHYVSAQLKSFEKQYKKLDAIDFFCDKSLQLAKDLDEKGLSDISGIIYSGLIKIPTLTKEKKEAIVLLGLKNAEKKGDNIHILSRIVDLKYLYKNGNKKKYIGILFKEEQQLTLITEKYQQRTSGFRTVARDKNSLEKYTFRLAASKVDLGKALLRSNPEVALRKLQEAEQIFLSLNKTKEASFAQSLISQINTPT